MRGFICTAIMQSSEKEEIVKRIRQCITPDDIIAAMFSFLDKEEFPSDIAKIHTALYNVKKQFPRLLEEFIFSENDVYPYSPLLERVLFRLQNSGLISTVNPEFKKCIISNESKKFIKKEILPLFDKDKQKEIFNMGKLFEKLLLT